MLQPRKVYKSFLYRYEEIAGVLEIIEDYNGDTYRAVYTVKFENVLYILHCFQKKSKKGKATPKQEIDLIKQRLKMAETNYQEWLKNQGE